MSIGLTPNVAGLAGTQLAQSQGTEASRAQQDSAQFARAQQSAERAADAVSRTEEESGAGDRDADGRVPWEIRRATRDAASPETPADEAAPPVSRDATGQIGKGLDLTG